MMPANASVIVAGQLYWTDPSHAWLKKLMQRYQSAMGDLFKLMPESEREAGETILQGMSLWSSDRIIDCQRGDLALAMDYQPDGMRILQVVGVSDAEKCRGALGSAITTLKAASGGKALVDTDVLEPEKLTTYVYQVRLPKTLDTRGMMPPEGMKVRLAEIGDLVISGTDEWASRRSAGRAPAGGG